MKDNQEYAIFHRTKWDDIFDESGNVVMPRENQYWFDGFYGLADCKDWIADGHNKGDRMGALTVVDTFVIPVEKQLEIIPEQIETAEAILVCVHTSKNLHRWQKVMTVEDSLTFINSFNNDGFYGAIVRMLVFKESDIIRVEDL